MPTEILINVRSWETRVACVDHGILTDLVIERKSNPTYVGSVFKGRVIKVLPGMQAAFIEIGLEKAGFLYVRDIFPYFDENEDDFLSEESILQNNLSNAPKIQELIHEGQYVLVQVAKDPLGTKGPRLTMNISLPGRFIVYMPTVRHLGISRKIESLEERERLKNIVSQMNYNAGIIVRTAGEGANEEDLKSDLEYLERVYQEISRAYEKRKGVGLLHQEPEIELRVLRDFLNSEVSEVVVDDQEIYKKVTRFISQLMPKYKQNIIYYQDSKPLFEKYGIEIEISRSMERKIWLKSGGYIVIDEAEALVVIDVNTGRFVGKKDLEDTILKTNLEAVQEIAHQIRIRNIGGIIIIDLIDMEKLEHRNKVLEFLQEELKKDRSRTQIISMSSLGLVELTRKRTRPSLNRILTEPCQYCEGKGYVKKKSTVAMELLRNLEKQTPSVFKRYKIRCRREIIDWIYEQAHDSLMALEVKLNRSFEFEIADQFHIEQYEILPQNS